MINMKLFLFIELCILKNSLDDLFKYNKSINEYSDDISNGYICESEYYGYPHHKRKRKPISVVSQGLMYNKVKDKHFNKYVKEGEGKGQVITIPSKRKYKMLDFTTETKEDSIEES